MFIADLVCGKQLMRPSDWICDDYEKYNVILLINKTDYLIHKRLESF